MTKSEHPGFLAPGAPDAEGAPGKFVNCTQHEVQLFRIGQPPIRLEPAATPARVTLVKVGAFHGVDIVQRMGEVEGLPEPELNTIYVVSRMVKDAVPERIDCVVPTDMVRDEHGHVIGCKRVAL